MPAALDIKVLELGFLRTLTMTSAKLIRQDYEPLHTLRATCYLRLQEKYSKRIPNSLILFLPIFRSKCLASSHVWLFRKRGLQTRTLSQYGSL
jgi:hypothetical protein